MTEHKRVLASSMTSYAFGLNGLSDAYAIPDPLPWALLAAPLARAEDGLARLDGMDVRAPTHQVVRAHAVLRARRRIAAGEPGWALSPGGLDALRGGRGERAPDKAESPAGGEVDEGDPKADAGDGERFAPAPDAYGDDELASLLAGVDQAIAKAERALRTGPQAAAPRPARDPLVYDGDWNEAARLSDWRETLAQTRALPPTLAAALALEAWDQIQPLEHRPWLGALLAAALLRERGKARAHLPCLAVGLRAVPRGHRRSGDPAARLIAWLDAIMAAAEAGLKDHDRWLTARMLLMRKLEGKRGNSSLPGLIEMVLSRPLVSAGMIARELKVTSRAAQDLVRELGLREATGRGRYRAWGIL